MKRSSIPAAVALLTLTLVTRTHAVAREPLEPGAVVPPVTLYDAGSQPHPLSDLLGPKGALIVFWASWSPRSTDILVFLGPLQEKYGKSGMKVIAINAEHEALEPAQMEELARRYKDLGLPWPSYFDPKLEAYASLGIMTLPSSLSVGADLKVAAVYPGFPTGEGKAALVELLEKSLGIWVAPVEDDRPVPPQYAPKAGAAQRAQLGRRLFERNQKRKSVEEFQNALKADPDFAMAFATAAFVARAAGLSGEQDAFVAELTRRQSELSFQEALGVILAVLGKTDESRQVLQPLLEREEPRTRGLLALAYAHHQKGQVAESLSVLEKLKAWPKGGKTFLIDVSAYLSADSSAEDQWKKPLPFFLKLLDLPTPLGFGLKNRDKDSQPAKEAQPPNQQ